MVCNSLIILVWSSDDKLFNFKFSIWARKEEGRKDLAGDDKEQSYRIWGEGSDCVVERTKLRTEELKPPPVLVQPVAEEKEQAGDILTLGKEPPKWEAKVGPDSPAILTETILWSVQYLGYLWDFL